MKSINNGQMAALLANILTNPFSGEVDAQEAFEEFFTELTKLVCNYCGGEVISPATYAPAPGDQNWATHYLVEVTPSASSPDGGGIWASPDLDAKSSAGLRSKALEALKGIGLTFSECITVFGADDKDPFVAAARNKASEGELEVDAPAVVSHSDEGAYVMGWIWVSNEAAGILSNSEVLEKVLDHARLGLAGQHGLDAATEILRDTQTDWLEDLISNFADELDGIESEVLKGVPGPITWVDGSGKAVRFMPSDALSQLRLLARQNGLSDTLADQSERFCIQYGNKLDAILAALQTT
ncbi:MAG: hypothetical protein OEL20_04690 [Sulfuritalea sp.]|nr:hypothetical protein [Sulfuritalea sp.]